MIFQNRSQSHFEVLSQNRFRSVIHQSHFEVLSQNRFRSVIHQSHFEVLSQNRFRSGRMSEAELGAHTIKSHGASVARNHSMIGLYCCFLCQILCLCGLFLNNVYDLHHSILGLLFAVLITGVLTDAIKDAVGRPRPDFFWCCFPDGIPRYDDKWGNVICHGNPIDIKEGYKSFLSGHTSWSFAGLGFLSWYLAGKIQAFDRRGHISKLCIVFFPLLLASLVGVSRVDDYWHHWPDVFAAALIGLVVATFCYLQFFPLPNDTNVLVKQVLNAGKNKLKSMDEVRSLLSLRALILNDKACCIDVEILSRCLEAKLTVCFAALLAETKSPYYAGGYHSAHYVIDMLWAVLKNFSMENQMKFLKQLRNLEKAFGGDVRVCDRTALILDIFNQKAATHEAALQVALAQMESVTSTYKNVESP
ncbi:Lipid phosphate phosphatase 2 [Camellia lanceoleosa]|uniref:Lipid phosphate phosphatase 2 n=1 Tax=Camellia lanceoleosa TaxID=1840588 RepID=A0ACC0GL04_9ERIC|nr:Lipid phosphate phosphatase 2 [Camellia lanceoleosa]